MTWTSAIADHERRLLRSIVRRVHFSKTRRRMLTPDSEIDKFIDQMGPEVMENLKQAAAAARLREFQEGKRIYSLPNSKPGGRAKSTRKPRVENMVRRWLMRLQDTVPGVND